MPLIYKYLAAKACSRLSVFTSDRQKWMFTFVLWQFYTWRSIRKEAVWAPGMFSVPTTCQSYSHLTERCPCHVSILQSLNWTLSLPHINPIVTSLNTVPATYQFYSHLTELCPCHISILLNRPLSLLYNYHISSNLTQLFWITVLYNSCIYIKEVPFVYMHNIYFVKDLPCFEEDNCQKFAKIKQVYHKIPFTELSKFTRYR